MKKAIIFARVSTKRQEKEGLSLKEIQLPRAERYAEEKCIDVVKTFTISETASDHKARKTFEEMTKYFEEHPNITEIISFRVDRITRNYRDAVVMDDLRLKHDKFIHCIDDRLVLHKNSSANDLQNWDTKVYLAKQFLNRVTEDGNNTKYNKLDRGELPWGCPYGYKHAVISENPKVKSVISVEPQATIVRQIHIRFSSGSFSCKSLAEAINKEFGTRFYKGKINHILRDDFYIGEMTDKKTGDKYPHRYERLVSDDIFGQNQAILEGHSNKRSRYGGIPSVYRSLIGCVCGCTVTPEQKTKKQKNGNIHQYYYYRCSNGKNAHDKLQYIPEKELDDAIQQVLRKFNIPKERMKQLRNDLNETHIGKVNFYEGQRQEITQRRQQLSNRQQNTYDMMADKCITLEQYNENNARYAEELANLQRRESQLDQSDQQFYITAGYLLSIFEHAERLFKVAQIEEKRQIIGLLLSNLTLDGKKFSFNLKEPFDTLINMSKGSLCVWTSLLI
ncbi:MAG: recombinase family protein [Candidatus Saccharimonadales bacterium]